MANTALQLVFFALLLISSSGIHCFSKKFEVEAMELQPTGIIRRDSTAPCHASCETHQDCIDANCGKKCFIMSRPINKISHCLS
ncbi:hypothetical protein ABFS82_07G068800 [Erythranthe guttata]|uniref:WAP domain-containing protein n=1 Tax=Erythranthe guttata TaxID=4155 RepID=A0A022QY72_ERYGU|nr:hypothetical protein MIMGU_mgv1a017288mg [Erythranthe guttata]